MGDRGCVWQIGKCFSSYMLKLSLSLFSSLSFFFFKGPGSKSCLDYFNGCSGSFPSNYLPVPEWVVLVQSPLQILWRPQNSWIKASKSNKLFSEQWNLWSQASCASPMWMLWWLITSVSLKWLHMWILWWLIKGELTLWFFSSEEFLTSISPLFRCLCKK